MADNPETHSRRVARLRKLLPALALVACLALVFGAAPDIGQILGSKRSDQLRNALGGLAISDPVFEGNLSDDGRTYRMTAKSGTRNSDARIELKTLSLNVSPAPNGTRQSFTLNADRAELDVGTQTAQFQGIIEIDDSLGASLSAQSLTADLAQGVLYAPQGITMQTPSGTLEARTLRADTKSQIYVFEKAQLRLAPQGEAKP